MSRKSFLLTLFCASSLMPAAQNPIVQTAYTPDPAPYVHGDTVYLFTGHDADTATYFRMSDWQLYSSMDMANWTYRGTPLTTATFSWARQGDNAWASQAVERDGKWYWYVAAEDSSKGLHGIGVAVSDSPTGHYTDPIGRPLIPGAWGFIDPCVFVDDDGQAYIFWGNNGLWYARLGRDMVSLDGEIVSVNVNDTTAFGPLKMKYDYGLGQDVMKTNYEEAPWIYKIGDTYYLEYAAGGVPEHWAYATATHIDGPWTYRGRILDESPGSFTIHGGSIHFADRDFMFYHCGRLPDGGGFRRSTSVEEFRRNADGSIPFIPITDEGVIVPVRTLDPYKKVEAETMADSRGLQTDRLAGDFHYITAIDDGDWLKLRSVDFGRGASAITLRMRSSAGGTVELLADSLDGRRIAEINVGSTAGEWKTVTSNLKSSPTGIHDLYFRFRGKGSDIMEVDWWKMEETHRARYRNPIIYADVPDMSVVRVGDYYYMVSTTMHLMPGAPIMRSSDMQHWETVSYVFPRIDDAPRYNLVDSTAYGQGQWASSLRYHNGKFYLWFSANGSPHRGFVYTADKAEGSWQLVARPPHFHDGSLFFDDDGKVYIFHGTGHLTELDADLSDVKEGGIDMQIFERDADEQALLEGSSVIKHDGMYYLLMISMDWDIPGRLRREVCYRAEKITGPYEKRVILETEFEGFGGVGQGCIVDGKDGEWYGLIFQDRGGVGRVPCLMPCTWVDGWPMLGDKDGKIPNDTTLAHTSLDGICGSDDFSAPELKLYWQWSHNPVDSAWSLTECLGSLRLHTARVVDNLFLAPNTISQRMVGPTSTATVELDVSGMIDGDRAGFAAFNGDSGVLAIKQDGDRRRLVMSEESAKFSEPQHAVKSVETRRLASADIPADKVFLRIHADFTNGKDIATFFYSLDGEQFIPIGSPVKMTYDYTRMFMGSRFAIFNYATKQLGGHVDVGNFQYDWQ